MAIKVNLIDGKYKEYINNQPVRVKPDKWVRLDRQDAPEFIYKHLSGGVLKGRSLNCEWCYEVWKDMLQFSRKDPTLTLIFEQRRHLWIDTSSAFEYSRMRLRDYLAMTYEHDHVFFKRKTRSLT